MENMNLHYFVMKLLDQNVKPDWCDKTKCSRKLKKELIRQYKKRQILNIDEILKRKNTKELNRLSRLIGNRKTIKFKHKILKEIKDRALKKTWRQMDNFYLKLKIINQTKKRKFFRKNKTSKKKN